MANKSKWVAGYVLTVGMVSASQATVILSSFSAGSTDQTRSNFSVSDTRWEAIGFDTGTEGVYSVDAVKVRLSGLAEGQVSVSIYTNSTKDRPCIYGPGVCNYNAPDVLVGSLGSQTVQAKADYSFEQMNGIQLAPSSRYWVVLKGLGPEAINYYEYMYPGDPWYSPFKSQTGASIYDFVNSPGDIGSNQTLGVTWVAHSGLNLIQIEGALQAVPEPTVFELLIAGIAAIGLAGWNRKRRYSSARSVGPEVASEAARVTGLQGLGL